MESEAPPLPSEPVDEIHPPLPPESLPQGSSKHWGNDDGEGTEKDSEAPAKRRRIDEECALPVLGLEDALGSPPNSNSMLGRLDPDPAFNSMDFEELSSDENSVIVGLEDGEIEDGGDSKDSTPGKMQSKQTEHENGDKNSNDAEMEEPEVPRRRPRFSFIKTHQGPPPPEDALPEVKQMLQEEEKEKKLDEEKKIEEERRLEAEKKAEMEADDDKDGDADDSENAESQDDAGRFKQEFVIIDDVEGSDNESQGEGQDVKQANDIAGDVYDSDYIDEDEIEALLDEDLNNKKKQRSQLQSQDYEVREKTVLVDRGGNPFDILPEGWVQVCHRSGMPVYLHRQSRVCTLSRPYFLGPGSVRRHDIPISAVPCLQYRRALEDEKLEAEMNDKQQTGENSDSPNLQSNEISQSDNAVKETSMDLEQQDSSSHAEKNEIYKPKVEKEAPDVKDPSSEKSKQDESNTEVDPSAAMLSKLQDELNALAQCSTPSTPRTPSPTAETLENAQKIDAEKDKAVKSEDTKPSCDDSDTSKSDKDKERLKAILSGSVTLGKKQECPFKQGVKGRGAPQVKSIEEHKATQNLNSDQIKEYCNSLFQFKVIQVKRFTSWNARHNHRKAVAAAHRNAHSLPSGTQILTCDITPKDSDNRRGPPSKRKKEFVLNLKGKNDVCILHEYAQHVLRVQPSYDFKETTNAEKPFCTTISINGIAYGTGSAASKKLAKSAAARDALNVLLPEVAKFRAAERGERSDFTNEYAFFDEIKIEDPRILELSTKSGQPLPFSILQECLKRNFGMGDTNIVMDMHIIRPQKSQFTMKVAQFEGKVMCKSKKEGKHMASQQILQKMHPQVKSWGSILRMYARDIEAVKMKQEVEGDNDEELDLEPQNQMVEEEQKTVGSKLSDVEMENGDGLPPETSGNSEDKPQLLSEEKVKLQEKEAQMKKELEERKLQLLRFIKDKYETEPAQVQPPATLTVDNGQNVAEAAEDNQISTESDVKEITETKEKNREFPEISECNRRQHAVTQTEWAGIGMFHKATQFPEQMYMYSSLPQLALGMNMYNSYTFQPITPLQNIAWASKPRQSPTELRKSPVTVEKIREEKREEVEQSEVTPGRYVDVGTQTDIVGITVLHKGCQFPESPAAAAPQKADADKNLSTNKEKSQSQQETKPALYEGEENILLHGAGGDSTNVFGCQKIIPRSVQEAALHKVLQPVVNIPRANKSNDGAEEKANNLEDKGGRAVDMFEENENKGGENLKENGKEASASEGQDTSKVPDGTKSDTETTDKPQKSKTGAEKEPEGDRTIESTAISTNEQPAVEMYKVPTAQSVAMDPLYSMGYMPYASTAYGYGTSFMQQPYFPTYSLYPSTNMLTPMMMPTAQENLAISSVSTPPTVTSSEASAGSSKSAKSTAGKKKAMKRKGEDLSKDTSSTPDIQQKTEKEFDFKESPFIGPQLPQTWPSTPKSSATVSATLDETGKNAKTPDLTTSDAATSGAATAATDVNYVNYAATQGVAMMAPGVYGSNYGMYPQSGAMYYPGSYTYMYPGWGGYM